MSVFNKKRFTIRRKRKFVPASPPEETTQDNPNADNKKDKEIYEEIIPPPLHPDEMPTYFHIGVLAKDCLVNGYKIGAWHFDCTTELGDNLSLYSFGTGKPEFKNVFGGLGAREHLGSFSLTQVWLTDGLVGMVAMENEIFGGMANSLLRAAYEPNDRPGVKVELHSGYEVNPFRYHVILPILREPKLMGYVLFNPYKNYILSYRAVYDIEQKGFDKHAIGLGYSNGNTELGLKFENFEDIRGSIFQRLGDRFAVAFKANYYKSEEMQYAIGGQCALYENVIIKAKYRHDGFFGMVYQQTLNDRIAIMYHFGFAINDPLKSDHKFGVSWSLRGLTAWKKKKNRPTSVEPDPAPEPGQDAPENAPPEAEYEIIPPESLEGEVPTFFHIGRWAKECLITGYRIGVWHIDCTARAKGELSLYSFGIAKPDFKTVAGGVGFKKKTGILTMSQAWLTNEFFSSIGLEKRGESVSGEATLRALYNRANAYKIDLFCGVQRSPVRMEVIAPIVNVSKIMGYALWQPFEKIMLAYRAVYDFEGKAFEKQAFAVGFNNNSTEFALKFEDFKDLRGSIFQRLSDRWAIALKAALLEWKNVDYSIGCQFMVNESTMIKAKITSQEYLAFVYQQFLSENIRIMYHFGFALDDPIKSNHKFGVSWSINC